MCPICPSGQPNGSWGQRTEVGMIGFLKEIQEVRYAKTTRERGCQKRAGRMLRLTDDCLLK